MEGRIERVALVSMHTHPAQQPGTGDSGGLNVTLMSTARELAKRGVSVELLTRTEGAPFVTVVEPRISIHALPAGMRGAVDKADLPELTDEFGEAVAQLAGRTLPRYDIIHAHYWLSGIATLPVALELDIPFVQTFHTLGAMKNRHRGDGQGREPDRRMLSERYLAGQANAVVAVSSAEVESLIDDLGAPAERLWVIPPGVDSDVFRPDRPGSREIVRAAFDVEMGTPVLALVGRVQPLKGQELAIRALAELLTVREKVPTLVIAGEPTPGDEPYAESLRDLAEELGVSSSVVFAGALDRDALADLLSAATLTLIPSHSETFGLVALESAASGTPVVAYQSTGLAESVSDGVSGVLLATREPRAWAATINRLLNDSTERNRLSTGALDHAANHTWAASTAATLALYESLAQARQR